MKDDIITYREMCDLENVQTLQRGMNYRLNFNYSVILMSQRSNAPYEDEILDDNKTIIYEGHNIPRNKNIDPKTIDQPYQTKTGKLTQNGKFAESVKKYKNGEDAEKIKVYEKIFPGVWSFRGIFKLIDYKYVSNEKRNVFKFYLELCNLEIDMQNIELKERTRIIPTEVKKEVWRRDEGRCVICGATDELHFDHDIPYSKGGTSISVDNVKILCARHNLQKSDKIE